MRWVQHQSLALPGIYKDFKKKESIRERKSYAEKIAVNELLKTILETVIKFSSLSLIFRNKTWNDQLHEMLRFPSNCATRKYLFGMHWRPYLSMVILNLEVEDERSQFNTNLFQALIIGK